MVKITKEETEVIEAEAEAGDNIYDVVWEIAEMALLKDKIVNYTFNKGKFKMTPEEAKKRIYPNRVRNKILELEGKEEGLMEELLDTRKEKKEMKEFLKTFEDTIFKDSPK